ncbi:HAUS augmin-like complex subunit 1 [Borealophlyctis nickersoniae]|nr:HAUS augmin-like complex subunit 1 [Borealophlyctis nickersoniae]
MPAMEQKIADKVEEEYETEGSIMNAKLFTWALSNCRPVYTAIRLGRVLGSLGIEKANLSKTGEVNLHTLTSLALSLGLSETSLVSYECAIGDLLSREKLAELELERQRASLQRLNKERKLATTRLKELKGILLQLNSKYDEEKETLNDWRQNTALLHQKGEEYGLRLRDLEAEYRPEMDAIRYDVLRSLQAEGKNLANLLEEKERTLTSFNDLPPDITLARIKLGEKKQELAQLIEYKQELLGSIAQQIQ